MKKLSLLSSTAVLVIGISSFSPMASAQSADALYIVSNIANPTNPGDVSIVTAINSFTTWFQNSFFNWLKTYLIYNWQETQPNLSQITEIQNPLGGQLTMTQDAAVGGLSSQIIASSIGPSGASTMTGATLSAALASNFAADVFPPTQAQAQKLGASPQAIQLCGNNMFNFESLMGYSSYANQTLACNPNNPQNVSQYANNYIQYVMNLGMPINNFNINNAVNGTGSSAPLLTQAQATNQLLTDQTWIDFTNSRRNLISMQSAAMSNLTYLYNQRAPDSNGNSPESVANYIANWRTQNVNGWYDTMSTTADLPILMRETLFIMAEIQRDLHEMRKENQRMMAAQAVLIAQGTVLGKQVLNMRYTAVQAKIASITGASGSSSGSTGSSSSSSGASTSSSEASTINQVNQQSNSVQSQGQAAINAAVQQANAPATPAAAPTTNP